MGGEQLQDFKESHLCENDSPTYHWFHMSLVPRVIGPIWIFTSVHFYYLEIPLKGTLLQMRI